MSPAALTDAALQTPAFSPIHKAHKARKPTGPMILEYKSPCLLLARAHIPLFDMPNLAAMPRSSPSLLARLPTRLISLSPSPKLQMYSQMFLRVPLRLTCSLFRPARISKQHAHRAHHWLCPSARRLGALDDAVKNTLSSMLFAVRSPEDA